MVLAFAKLKHMFLHIENIVFNIVKTNVLVLCLVAPRNIFFWKIHFPDLLADTFAYFR